MSATGNGWRSALMAAGVAVALVASISGWGYSLGVQQARLDAAETSIERNRVEVAAVRTANTYLAVQIGRLETAVNNLTQQLREERNRRGGSQ